MIKLKLFALLCGLWLSAALAPLVHAQVAGDPTPIEFKDAAEEARFHHLTSELRCVMCQNQSLADSNAQIAHDLRREVLELMRQGKDNEEIKSFLVERYGEFVLYTPTFSGKNTVLWLGPLVLLIVGGIIVVRIVRRKRRHVPDQIVDDGDQEW